MSETAQKSWTRKRVAEPLIEGLLGIDRFRFILLYSSVSVAISLGVTVVIDFFWDARYNYEPITVGLIVSLLVSLVSVALVSSLFSDMRREVGLREKAMREASEQNKLTAQIVETIPMRVFWKSRDLRYLGCNTLFARDAGFQRPSELIGLSDYDMAWQREAEAYRADDRSVMNSAQPKIGYEETQTTPDGQVIWLRTSKVPLRNDAGAVRGMLGVYDDITERKKIEEEYRRLATTDSLTGILNRHAFSAELEREHNRIQRYGGSFVLLMFDLDHFKQVNDNFGHVVGDHVLQEISAAVTDNIRANDVFARWGGEEFMLLIPNADAESGSVYAEKLRRLIEAHSLHEGPERVSASFGLALCRPGMDSRELLKQVDDALYLAKERGRNRVEWPPQETRGQNDAGKAAPGIPES